jgi:hypothetical protein|tara:strand:- start:239 stop:451 length:213 start_codon:yes stop_codon:yes gene_type:complete
MKEDELVKRARDEVLAELFLRKQQRRKDYNRNVLSVRTNDELTAKVRDHCTKNNISTNQFFKTLLTNFFK